MNKANRHNDCIIDSFFFEEDEDEEEVMLIEEEIKNMNIKEDGDIINLDYIPSDWKFIFEPAIEDIEIINEIYTGDNSFIDMVPRKKDIFKPFYLCRFSDVKVVIFTTKPCNFYRPGNKEIKSVGLGPSLAKDDMGYTDEILNIKAMLKRLFNYNIESGDLTPWAKQGVLLLNVSLVINAGGDKISLWRCLIMRILEGLQNKKRDMVYIFWCDKEFKTHLIPRINAQKNCVLKSDVCLSDPNNGNKSNFISNNNLISCNSYLKSRDITPIKWTSI